MLDVDHFKSINDTFGHVFGDRVLRAIADTLKAHVKGKDSVSRFGGEEFAVLLPDSPLAAGHVVAEQLRLAVAALEIRYSGGDKPIPKISVSCGVACRRDDDSGVALVERADKALYRAKGQGRNCVVVEGLEA